MEYRVAVMWFAEFLSKVARYISDLPYRGGNIESQWVIQRCRLTVIVTFENDYLWDLTEPTAAGKDYLDTCIKVSLYSYAILDKTAIALMWHIGHGKRQPSCCLVVAEHTEQYRRLTSLFTGNSVPGPPV
jgi:hypothetical protein